MRRVARRPRAASSAAALALALAVGIGAPGCGGDHHLQAQESVALVRTCQSLYERDHDAVPPSLPTDFMRSWLRNAPRGFAGRSTRDEFRHLCDLLPDPASEPKLFP